MLHLSIKFPLPVHLSINHWTFPGPQAAVLKVHKILLEVAKQLDQGEFLKPPEEAADRTRLTMLRKWCLEELQRLKIYIGPRVLRKQSGKERFEL
ncbi:hypothetical protein M0R45_027734 [Rubus argutus]|uniref:Uncharacterized protein n=1 Tax=Rubus argutus TaxID=59490 RepID=A0AAW1X505_RUBAR